MKFTLGFSPCPNDTFIFDALVNKKIDTGDFEFEVHLEDVQTLNNWALNNKLDVSKISYGVLPLITGNYKVLSSGGALGKGVGPLLISKKAFDDPGQKIGDMTVAIPGENTTAHLLFSYAFPNARKKKFMIFNQIEEAVLAGRVDCGVIIHENRFTYQDKGLVKLVDLGEYWETKTAAPIPLGGIVVKNSIEPGIQLQLEELIRKSINFSFHAYPQLSTYVSLHAQEMSETVMRKHIDLYVNNFSLDLGPQGKGAVQKLFEVYARLQGKEMPAIEDVFVRDQLPA